MKPWIRRHISAVLLQRVLIGIGGLLISFGVLSDWLGFGTAGEGLGPSQGSLILLGIGLLLWSGIVGIQSVRRYWYAFAVACLLLLVWSFWPYPVKWEGLRSFLLKPLALKLILFSSFSIFMLAIAAVVIAIADLFPVLKKAVLINCLLLLISLMGCGMVAEFVFRTLLFSANPAFKSLRNPDFYADWFLDDDYWKLQYLFGPKYPPPEHPHPLLGWVGNFSRDTYRHDQEGELTGRQAVLLYGDSYADCVSGLTCFEDVLNHDPEFSRQRYLLNYGVSGYCVGQIYLLLQQTLDLYDRPYIVVSLMTFDLDRSVLSVRIGQKPYFVVEDDQLLLRGLPINPNPAQYFIENPPHIRSYLYRKILYGTLFPKLAISFFRNEQRFIENMQQVNRAIIMKIVQELEQRHLQYVFLIFHPHIPTVSRLDNEDDWRDQFLRAILDENQIPYIWSKDIFKKDVEHRSGNFSFDEYISPANFHPTSYFNQLIAKEIKRHVMRTP